jgi:transketolase
LEQIKIDVCAMKLPVTFIGVGTAYAYSYDGPTHHATEDVSIMRSLAGMTILSPSDSAAAAACADYAQRLPGPSYVRLDRGKMPLLFDASKDDLAAGSRVMRPGGALALISTGSTVHRVLELAERLEQGGVAARVVDLYRLKPVDSGVLLGQLDGCSAVVTLEEHTVHGGLGSIVAETLMDAGCLLPLKRLAIDDPQLYAYGMRDIMLCERGLDADGAAAAVATWLKGLNQSKE